MSDNQRRLFCQFLFLLLCVVPTTVVGYWICHPQTANGWELKLRAKLGVETSIASIETPGPYVTILRGLEFSDPVIGTLFKAAKAEIEFGTESNIVSIPYRVQGLTNQGLASLIQTVNENLIRSHGVDKPWQIRFSKDALVNQAAALDARQTSGVEPLPQFPMSDIQLDIFPTVDGTHCNASFRVPGFDMPDQLVKCSLSRTQDYDQLLLLDTNNVAVPCWLVADSVPEIVATLGSKSRFKGRLELVPTQGDFQVAVKNGVFERVDLEATLAIPAAEERFAKIELDDCFFERDKFTRWDASIVQGSSPRMRISQNRLFNYTRQFAPGEAIKEALMERWANRVVDQPYR